MQTIDVQLNELYPFIGSRCAALETNEPGVNQVREPGVASRLFRRVFLTWGKGRELVMEEKRCPAGRINAARDAACRLR